MPTTDWDQVIGLKGRMELMRFRMEMIKYRGDVVGWSHRDLMQALAKTGSRNNPEVGSMSWQMADAQNWCQVLGGRLVVGFSGLPASNPDELDAMVANLKAIFPRDEFERWYTVRSLAAARIAAGISTAEMGKRIGISAAAVNNWEQRTGNPLIPGLMRHAFAIAPDSMVHLDFLPVEPIKGPQGRKRS